MVKIKNTSDSCAKGEKKFVAYGKYVQDKAQEGNNKNEIISQNINGGYNLKRQRLLINLP